MPTALEQLHLRGHSGGSAPAEQNVVNAPVRHPVTEEVVYVLWSSGHACTQNVDCIMVT